MAHLYIALVDTPGFFAALIRFFIKQRYIHVVLAFDAKLEEAYSVGRRHPAVPFLAGVEREDKHEICRVFPEARYMIARIDCTVEQKRRIKRRMRRDWEQRYSYHYAIIGLPFIIMKKPFYQKKHYTCSSYIAQVLEESGIRIADKHFSLVTPRDFYEYEDKQMIFEGGLTEIIDSEEIIEFSEKENMQDGGLL